MTARLKRLQEITRHSSKDFRWSGLGLKQIDFPTCRKSWSSRQLMDFFQKEEGVQLGVCAGWTSARSRGVIFWLGVDPVPMPSIIQMTPDEAACPLLWRFGNFLDYKKSTKIRKEVDVCMKKGSWDKLALKQMKRTVWRKRANYLADPALAQFNYQNSGHRYLSFYAAWSLNCILYRAGSVGPASEVSAKPWPEGSGWYLWTMIVAYKLF